MEFITCYLSLESVVDPHRPVQNTLKKIGHAVFCVHEDETSFIFLFQLRTFLEEFEKFTQLITTAGPNLVLVSFIELKIQKNVQSKPDG